MLHEFADNARQGYRAIVRRICPITLLVDGCSLGRRKVLRRQSIGGASDCLWTMTCPSNALFAQNLPTPLDGWCHLVLVLCVAWNGIASSQYLLTVNTMSGRSAYGDVSGSMWSEIWVLVVKALLKWSFSASALPVGSDIVTPSTFSNACTVSPVMLDESPELLHTLWKKGQTYVGHLFVV